MGKKQKKKQDNLYLEAPKGTKIKRHNIGGDDKEIRFTTPMDEFEKLIAVSKNNRFTWIHKDFR